MCRKLKVNVGKIRGGHEVVDFADQYKKRIKNQKQCKVIMNGQMQELNEFKYLDVILCKHETLEGDHYKDRK